MVPRRIYVRMGNRGIGLFVLGALWFLIGFSIATAPPPATESVAQRANLADDGWPVWLRAGLWLAPGVFAAVSAASRVFTHRASTERVDSNAWALLQIPLGEGLVFRSWAWLHGPSRILWLGMLIYAALVALVFICARGLDRLPPVPKSRASGGQG